MTASNRLAAQIISIHALREESDMLEGNMGKHLTKISIHALREESDHFRGSSFRLPKPFLSTLSVRRATEPCTMTVIVTKFLSTLSVRRATCPNTDWAPRKIFLSTLSVRRATEILRRRYLLGEISIHALREESDSKSV